MRRFLLQTAAIIGAFLAIEVAVPPYDSLFDSPAAAQTQPNLYQYVGPGTSGFLQNWAAQFYGYPVTVAALSGCSTGGSPTVVGNQAALKVTGGTTAATSCTITWPTTRAAAPVCNITGETTALTTVSTNNTTTLTWNFASTASTVWDIECLNSTP